jgi:beta-lactamase regulating signal transducer with metallopeptidase domain
MTFPHWAATMGTAIAGMAMTIEADAKRIAMNGRAHINAWLLTSAHEIARLLESATAQALGISLLHFLWQGAAAWIVLAVTLRALRRAPARSRYAVAAGVLFALPPIWFATFLITRFGGIAAISAEFERGASGIVSPLIANLLLPLRGALDGRPELLGAICGFWAAGVGALALRSAGCLVAARRVVRRAESHVPREIAEGFAALAARLGLPPRFELKTSAFPQAPCVIGILRPTIVLPAGALESLTAKQRDTVMAHEMAHIIRRDYLVNLLQRGVEVLLFFHPAVWWISAQVTREREHCCDDFAVAAGRDRLAYARALVALEAARSRGWAPEVAAAAAPLSERVRRILGLKPVGEGSRLRQAAIALATAAAGIAFATALPGGAPARLATAGGGAASKDMPAREARYIRTSLIEPGLVNPALGRPLVGRGSPERAVESRVRESRLGAIAESGAGMPRSAERLPRTRGRALIASWRGRRAPAVEPRITLVACFGPANPVAPVAEVNVSADDYAVATMVFAGPRVLLMERIVVPAGAEARRAGGAVAVPVFYIELPGAGPPAWVLQPGGGMLRVIT